MNPKDIYKSHIEFIEEVKGGDVWRKNREKLEQDARSDIGGVRKKVIEEFERFMKDGIFRECWEITLHDVDQTIEQVWEEEYSVPYFKTRLIFMMKMKWVEEHCPVEGRVKVDVLNSDAAKGIFAKLRRGGMLDRDNKPKGLSRAQKGVLASEIARRLGIENVWAVFGNYWGIEKESLRSGFNDGIKQDKMGVFIDKIKELID